MTRYLNNQTAIGWRERRGGVVVGWGVGTGEERDHTPVAMYGLRLVSGVCFLPKRNNNKMKRVRSFRYFFSSVSSQPSDCRSEGRWISYQYPEVFLEHPRVNSCR